MAFPYKPPADFSKIYQCNPIKWYQVQPYGFDFTGKTERVIVYLPISPNNLNITTHYATNIITTLYGVVEEHSEIRYYDIVISGTTGYAPRYPSPIQGDMFSIGITATKDAGVTQKAMLSDGAAPNVEPPFFTIGRTSFTNSPLIPNIGVGQQGISAINQAFDQTKELLGLSNPNTTGINPGSSGYVAFHNLYRLFHLYKKDAAGSNSIMSSVIPFGTDRTEHPLKFLNYKDGVMYDCVPRTFTMIRSAESPMLYNYQIVLRAYNLRDVYAAEVKPPLKLIDLGLGSLGGSLFSKFKNLAGGVKNIVGGLKSGLSAFGR